MDNSQAVNSTSAMASRQVELTAACADSNSSAWFVACWVWVMARLSHVDEVSFGFTDLSGMPERLLCMSVDPCATVEDVDRRMSSLGEQIDAASSGSPPHWHLRLTSNRPGSDDTWPSDGALRFTLGLANGRCTWARAGFHPQHHDPAWVEVVLHEFRRVAESAQLARAAAQWQWLQGAEYRRVVHEWNATDVDTPIEQCLHGLFEAQVMRTPRAVAAEFDGQCLSYAELDQRARHCACALGKRGVGPGSLVPLCTQRSLDMLVGVLAILKCGAAYVPIDPDLPAAQIRRMFDDCEPTVILAQQRFVERLPASRAAILTFEDLGDGDEVPSPATDPLGIACVMFTSGSTGVPKGTLIDHRSLVNNILWLQRHWPLDSRDRLLQKTPFGFDVSIKELLWPLAAGARVVLARPGGHLDMRYLAQTLVERQISVCHFVPSMLQRFLDELGAGRCDSLKLVMCGAEILPPRLKQRFFAHLDAQLLHLYGPTEAAISVTGWVCRPGPEARSVVPLGRPMDNVQIYLLDRAGVPVPPNVPGEIVIGGVAVARGYVKRAELQNERFVPDYFSSAQGKRLLYRTGDLARYRDDGVIEFIGRVDRQVKIAGARVELREVEITLQSHPSVRWAAVSAALDARGHARVWAYVVPDGAQHLSPLALRDFCAACLPAFMVPSAFVLVGELPLLPNGKVDYNALHRVAT